MKSLIICWDCDIEFPWSWSLFVFNPCKLFITKLETFGLFRVESVIKEEELRIGEIFTNKLTKIIFIFRGDIIFIQREDEFIESFFGDRKKEFIVLFDSNEIFGFIDNFTKESTFINLFNKNVDFILIRKLSEKKLFEIGHFDSFLLLNILEFLWGIWLRSVYFSTLNWVGWIEILLLLKVLKMLVLSKCGISFICRIILMGII